MKISIVGGGPAGLHIGTALRKINSGLDITIYERGPKESVDGIGYTLGNSVIDALEIMDPQVRAKFQRIATPPYHSTDLESHGEVSPLTDQGFLGIRRPALVNYMREVAQDSKVRIIYNAGLNKEDVERLAKESDLVIGADGANSVVRAAYAQEFGVSTINGKNRFIWLESNSQGNYMRFTFKEHKRHVYLAASYPIDRNSNSTIVQCTPNGLEQSGLEQMVEEDGTISEEGLHLLSNIFSNGSRIHFTSRDSRWRMSRFNTTQKVFANNVVLIGEAGTSIHYMTGSGLLLALSTAGILTLILAVSTDIQQSLTQYQDKVANALRDDSKKTAEIVSWLDSMDKRYYEYDRRNFTGRFIRIAGKVQ